MNAWVRIAIASIVLVVAAFSAFRLFSDEEATGPRVLVCPAPGSSKIFMDARRLCASVATALARIDGNGRVTYLIEPESIPCTLPSFEALSEDVTRMTGHGSRRCDTDTAGTTLYLFPHCSLTMNYPGNEDYLARLPIGLLVLPNDC